jgi:succinylglutamate desuccinylase
MLTIIDHIPAGLLDCSAHNLHEILTGPTLIHLPGRRPEPLFVSVLLHGNEPTGFQAIQTLLRRHTIGGDKAHELPRALSIFIGNVSAARDGTRHLPEQPDYNRCWPFKNCPANERPEHAMMQQIVDIMHQRKVFASIDIHNNTGLNPHYGCVNRLEPQFFHLATLFSRTVVYFIRPQGVQSLAFSEICPAVTVECGKPDQTYGATHAAEFVNTCLHLAKLPDHPVAAHDMDLFHTVATVAVPDHINIAFSEQDSAEARPTGIQFIADLDHLNFHELSSGITLGRVGPGQKDIPLHVTDERGEDVTSRYFRLDEKELRTAREVMPSMFTLDVEVIRQDCLGYLMERMDWK